MSACRRSTALIKWILIKKKNDDVAIDRLPLCRSQYYYILWILLRPYLDVCTIKLRNNNIVASAVFTINDTYNNTDWLVCSFLRLSIIAVLGWYYYHYDIIIAIALEKSKSDYQKFSPFWLLMMLNVGTRSAKATAPCRWSTI